MYICINSLSIVFFNIYIYSLVFFLFFFVLLLFFFFFSSRRRHTRWTGDWSSDVCSSDLLDIPLVARHQRDVQVARLTNRLAIVQRLEHREEAAVLLDLPRQGIEVARAHRSEERRVGKGCRSRWWTEEGNEIGGERTQGEK